MNKNSIKSTSQFPLYSKYLKGAIPFRCFCKIPDFLVLRLMQEGGEIHEWTKIEWRYLGQECPHPVELLGKLPLICCLSQPPFSFYINITFCCYSDAVEIYQKLWRISNIIFQILGGKLENCTLASRKGRNLYVCRPQAQNFSGLGLIFLSFLHDFSCFSSGKLQFGPRMCQMQYSLEG